MKAILLVLFLAAISTMSYADNKQSDFVIRHKEVGCSSLSAVIAILKEPGVDEKPIWIGKVDNKSTVVLLINITTRAWTLIQYQGDNACILEAGEKSEIVIPKK